MTENGKRILEIIEKSHNHPTAEDIYHQMLMSGRKMSLATVYNNLTALCEEGFIRKLSFDGKIERYDKPVRHDHLICGVCGRISDITLEDLTQMLEERSGVKLKAYDLKLFYICDECKRRDL